MKDDDNSIMMLKNYSIIYSKLPDDKKDEVITEMNNNHYILDGENKIKELDKKKLETNVNQKIIKLEPCNHNKYKIFNSI